MLAQSATIIEWTEAERSSFSIFLTPTDSNMIDPAKFVLPAGGGLPASRDPGTAEASVIDPVPKWNRRLELTWRPRTDSRLGLIFPRSRYCQSDSRSLNIHEENGVIGGKAGTAEFRMSGIVIVGEGIDLPFRGDASKIFVL